MATSIRLTEAAHDCAVKGPRDTPEQKEFKAKTGPELAALWAGDRPRLSVEEATAFEEDLRQARAELGPPSFARWD